MLLNQMDLLRKHQNHQEQLNQSNQVLVQQQNQPEQVSPPKFKHQLRTPRAAVVGPQVSEPKPAVGTPGPKFKNSDTIIRPDGVTEVLGPGGVVLEEIGTNGQLISDPIADIGFDPKDPPASIQALRDEFAEHVESGADEAGEIFYVSEETKEELINDGLGDVGEHC